MKNYYGIEFDDSGFPREIIESDGTLNGTCLFHRQWEWIMKNVVPGLPKCEICGGVSDPRAVNHYLCVEREKLGLPIILLDGTPKCGCAKCARKNGAKR